MFLSFSEKFAFVLNGISFVSIFLAIWCGIFAALVAEINCSGAWLYVLEFLAVCLKFLQFPSFASLPLDRWSVF